MNENIADFPCDRLQYSLQPQPQRRQGSMDFPAVIFDTKFHTFPPKQQSTSNCPDKNTLGDPGSPKLRMVSWNLNTLRFGGDYTPQSSSDKVSQDP